jgi:hypothetical protein
VLTSSSVLLFGLTERLSGLDGLVVLIMCNQVMQSTDERVISVCYRVSVISVCYRVSVACALVLQGDQ